jgi:hypothetical protein
MDPEIRGAFFEISQQMADAHQEQLERIQREFAEIMDQVQASIAALEPEATKLGRWGWTMPTWAPLHLLPALTAKASETEIDAVFLTLYNEQFRRRERHLLKELPSRTVLQPWKPLVMQCIRCYRRKQYLIVVPSLLIILEGVLVTAANQQHAFPKMIRLAGQQADKADTGTLRLGWISIQGFLAEVFGKAPFDAKRPLRINRHWVLHGRDKPQWKRVDCLRLFQALDMLASVAEN